MKSVDRFVATGTAVSMVSQAYTKSEVVRVCCSKMGCLCTRDEETDDDRAESNNEKVFSWDKRRNCQLNPNKYVADHMVGEEKLLLPGSVNGNQFLIKNCENSSIYVLDHMNTVSVDDCINCNIILGPVKGSVYIRDCRNCLFVVACGQLRIRDCFKLLIFLHCETQPVIEAANSISFGSYQLNYDMIEEHFRCADLDDKTKKWHAVYDFTPLRSETNWKFIENDKVSDYLPGLVSAELNEKLADCGQGWYQRDVRTVQIPFAFGLNE